MCVSQLCGQKIKSWNMLNYILSRMYHIHILVLQLVIVDEIYGGQIATRSLCFTYLWIEGSSRPLSHLKNGKMFSSDFVVVSCLGKSI